LSDYSTTSWLKLGKRVAVLIICMSLGGCGGCGTSKRAKIRTRTTLLKADVAVRKYRLANQKLPENAEGQKLIGQLRDDWNNADTGMRSLTGLTNLQYLCVGGTGVTDGALDSLHGLPLIRLDFEDTAISDEAFMQLRKTNPRLRGLLHRGVKYWDWPPR
jgi:hypothetical protein